MREIEISVLFSDKNGNQTRDTLVETISSNLTRNEVLTWVSDFATEWFYNIANEEASILWDEKGGGTDYEYERFLEKYLETCNFEWSIKKKNLK